MTNVTYISWNRSNETIAGAYLNAVGEVLADSRPENEMAMTGSSRMTAAQQTALSNELGEDIAFSTEAPEGW